MGALIASGFNAILTFFKKYLDKFIEQIALRWNWKIAAILFYVSSIATALAAVYLGASVLLGRFMSELPGGFFYGFCYMLIPPSLPSNITTVAAAWVLIKTYQWLKMQHDLFTALIAGSGG